MEEKQLDLNAPLLSVRRLSSASSHLDRETPKSNRNSRPNRQQSLPLYKSDWEPEQVTKPAAVPFLWEHIPGKAKQEKNPIPQKPSNSPRIIPPGKLLDTIKQISDNEDEYYNFFSPQMTSSPLNNEETEREEDVYADALEILSPSDSFSWNCSENSLNGCLDKCSFSSDQQTRDYLMSRFLPAAKSMIVETPQHVSKKLPAVTEVTEPPKYVKKVYSGELRLLLEQYRSSNISPYEQYRHDQESEEEIEEFDGTEMKSSKACGIFPWLRVKNSVCLLNPLPGSKSKIQNKAPVRFPSPNHIPRLARTSHSGPLTPSLEKQTMDAVYRKRAMLRSKEVHEIQPNQFMTLGYNREKSRGGHVSPFRNEMPRSPFRDGARFLGMPKQVQNVSVSPRQINGEGTNLVSPVVEKMYIDCVDKVETPRKLVHSKAEGYLDVMKPKASGKLDTVRKAEGVILQQDIKQELSSKVDPNGDLDNSDLQYPLAPPLPKSPSESWLWRKISMRNPSPKKHSPKSPMNGSAKWETIVKTSNVHHDHVRYSKELLRVSQHSET